MLFWYANYYFGIKTESKNRILSKIVFLRSKSYFDIRTESENANYYFGIKTESKNRILSIKILFWHSNWVGKCYFDIQNPI